MTKAEYAKLLKSPKWKVKREKILERDGHKCTRCGGVAGLQVHHVHYIDGRKPWQVPDHYLITVCGACHEFYHEKNGISVIKLVPAKKPKRKNKKPKKQKRVKELKPPDLRGTPAHLRQSIMQSFYKQRRKLMREQAIRDRKRNIRTATSDSIAQIENS